MPSTYPLTLREVKLNFDVVDIEAIDKLDRRLQAEALMIATKAAQRLDPAAAAQLLDAAVHSCLSIHSLSLEGRKSLSTIRGVRMIVEELCTRVDGKELNAENLVKEQADVTAVLATFRVASGSDPTKKVEGIQDSETKAKGSPDPQEEKPNLSC